MRPPVLLAVVLVLQNHKCFACLPKRTKVLTDSFVPVGIQAVNHYKTQLQRYYTYAFTDMCQTGKHDASISRYPLKTDICVAETVVRLNLFQIDLQREAVKQNLQNFQGVTRSVLTQMDKTSQMTSSQQFYFILQKLQKEGIRGRVTCKITDFLRDLANPSSKLFKNFAIVKPLNYLS